MRYPLTWLLLGAALAPLPAYAWGREGHAIIATLAERGLSQEAQAKVCYLLDGYSLPLVAALPDEWRLARPNTAGWHFVDIPLSNDSYNAARDCARLSDEVDRDCIVAALDHFVRVLSDKGETKRRRAEALTFVTHLIGDVHQPLHCADNDDLGGTAISIRFFGVATNLHAVWDDGILARMQLDSDRYADSLRAKAAPADVVSGATIDWVNETHALAPAAYVGVSVDGDLGESYQNQSLPIVNTQLLRAGVRLSHVIETALREMILPTNQSCATPSLRCPQLAASLTADDPMSDCGLFGSVDDPTSPIGLQNAMKNNLCASGPPIPLDFTMLLRLQAAIDAMTPMLWSGRRPPSDRRIFHDVYKDPAGRALGEGRLVSLVAFISDAHYANVRKGESVNCKLPGAAHNDIHITLVAEAGEEDKCQSVIAEVIPHNRPASWNVANLRRPTVPMRITGQLFVEANHAPCRAGKRVVPARFTIWELHPVYGLDVCKYSSIRECAADNRTAWMSFDDWLAETAEVAN